MVKVFITKSKKMRAIVPTDGYTFEVTIGSKKWNLDSTKKYHKDIVSKAYEVIEKEFYKTGNEKIYEYQFTILNDIYPFYFDLESLESYL